MPVNITTPNAIEESTYIVTVAFQDEDGNSFTPNHAYWTLTDTSGTVVNSESEIEIASLGDSVEIVLSGDDLALPEGADARRILTVEGTYDSDAGTDLPFKEQATFLVKNLTKSPLK
jgi:hypothetical protein